MDAGQRPLSPHLWIYRPQLTSVLSICHRLSGAALSCGLLLLVYWLAAAASGEAAYAAALGLFGAWPVKLLLFVFSVTFFYHLANGIRHLWWDSGRGFEISEVNASGWIAVIAALALTLLSWAVFLLGGAG